jgi:Nuclease-related domain
VSGHEAGDPGAPVSPRGAGPSRNPERAAIPGRTDPSRTPDPESGTILPVQRTRIRHLARDARMPVWRRRLLVAVALGILFTILTNWQFGLTVAVLAGIIDAIVRSRSSAASSAEGLTTGAQRRTKRELARLERSGYRALHIRAIPDSDEVIDHLLIGPTGVYAIDSEQWDKRLPVRTKNARQLWHGPFSQKERLEHARWEAAQAGHLLGDALGEPVSVRPAMAVYGPAIPWGVATIRDVDVFSGDRLRKYLRRHPAGARAPRLSASEVERIYTAADRLLRPKR